MATGIYCIDGNGTGCAFGVISVAIPAAGVGVTSGLRYAGREAWTIAAAQGAFNALDKSWLGFSGASYQW